MPIGERYIFLESEISFANYDEMLDNIIAQELRPGLFLMEQVRRVRLHIVRRRFEGADTQNKSIDGTDLLQVGDVIILTVRHEAIDGLSFTHLLDELVQAYKTGELLIDPNRLTYLDYTIHERQENKSLSESYWKEHHKDLNPIRFTSAIPSDHP